MDNEYLFDTRLHEEHVNAIYSVLARFWDVPCNYVFEGESVDECMLDNAGDWCEEFCGKIPDFVCWQKFIELKIKEG
jgi:hypothetical protein